MKRKMETRTDIKTLKMLIEKQKQYVLNKKSF